MLHRKRQDQCDCNPPSGRSQSLLIPASTFVSSSCRYRSGCVAGPGRAQHMTTAVHFRPLVAALLAGFSLTTVLRADDILQPPQTPEPGSVGELFTPPAQNATTPPVPGPPGSPSPEAIPTRGRPVPATAPPDTLSARGSSLLETMKPGDYERRKLKGTSELDWGFVNSEFVWRAPERGYDTPFDRGEWSTEDLVAVPMVGPFFVFGGVEMGGDYAADQKMNVIGRTGLLWKVPVNDSSAIVVRGGPSLKYNDALRLEKGNQQGSMLWEVKATAPLLLGPVGLEYLGAAQPAVTAVDRSQVNSDLALFVPVSGGTLKLGAKHKWLEGKAETRTVYNVMPQYLGFESSRW